MVQILNGIYWKNQECISRPQKKEIIIFSINYWKLMRILKVRKSISISRLENNADTIFFFTEHLLLDGQAQDYNFIKQSNKRIEGVDDAEDYQNLSVSVL